MFTIKHRQVRLDNNEQDSAKDSLPMIKKTSKQTNKQTIIVLLYSPIFNLFVQRDAMLLLRFPFFLINTK